MHNERATRHSYVFLIAVFPAYRAEAIGLLLEEMGDDVQLIASDAHLVKSVRSGIPTSLYRRVPLVRIGRFAYMQLGGWASIVRAETAVLDLNPRCVSAWILLLLRRMMARRTLLWGHLHPQRGASAKTAPLRRWMRRLAHGTIVYTYTSRAAALAELPEQQVWVAANALYRESAIEVPESGEVERDHVLYVGRFEPEKKPLLLLQGFSRFARTYPDTQLQLVGGGSDEPQLRAIAADLGIDDRVIFHPWENDVTRLAAIYAASFCSVSPGFAGLGLTQSLGFGVPQLVARDEPHSPEIELADVGGVTYFESDDPQSLADALEHVWHERSTLPLTEVAGYVRSRYSAERMAAGLIAALRKEDA